MKHILTSLQLIFLVIALLLGLSIHSDSDLLALAWWQMIAGLAQLFIAIMLTYKYWKSPSLKRIFICYWFVVAIEFTLLNKLTTDTGTWYYTVVFILPWCIATASALLFLSLLIPKNTIMKNKKIVIAGGTGFIGQVLAAWFGKDNQIIILGRQSVNEHNNNYTQKLLLPADGYNITYRRWDGLHPEKHWTNELEAADIVINLAGKSVNCRYTKTNKTAILSSRVNATKVIGEAIRNCTMPPKLWINAASATIYRHATDHPQDEYNAEMHNDFSVQVCKLWEKTFADQRTHFTRKVALRMAITLGHGGVMVPYFNLLKYFLGGKQGNGRQIYSWVHADDFCRVIEWMQEHKSLEGVYNCAAPNPVTNDFFMQTLRNATGHSTGLPAHEWMLSIGALLIGTEKELLLKSRWVVPTKLLETGFIFKFANLYEAVKDIVGKTERKKYHLS